MADVSTPHAPAAWREPLVGVALLALLAGAAIWAEAIY